jgi:hypothetical protein
MPSAARLPEGHADYKKGWEVRIVVDSRRELSEVRNLLKALKLLPGKPYVKGPRWVQPIYGRVAVQKIAGRRPAPGRSADRKTKRRKAR